MQYHFLTQYRFPSPHPPPPDLSACCCLFASVYCSPSYVRESGITDKICSFLNVGPPQQYAKYVTAPTQACLHIHHLFTFTTRLFIYLFSRLFDVPTSSCAHLTIILSFSSSCLCHSSLLPLIPFPQQSPNPFRPGSFRSTSFSSSWWAPFHNLFW